MTDRELHDLLAGAVMEAAYFTMRPPFRVENSPVVVLAALADDAGYWDEISRAFVTAMTNAAHECEGRGWTYAEVAHVVPRQLRKEARRIATDVLHGDSANVDGLLKAWSAQLGSTVFAVFAAAKVLGVVMLLPPMPVEAAQVERSADDDALFAKVRALLAKAESTEFPAEAEAFTAKAQELIARHAIDVAQLTAEGDAGFDAASVARRRILIDDPYANGKSMLVHVIARANRCTAVFNPDYSIQTVFGVRADLDAVEMLYTSLLIQATRAMAAVGQTAAQRTRAFRTSFMYSFAIRIGERLDEMNATVMADASANVLPVLASQEEAVADAVARDFPSRKSQRITVFDGSGARAGRAAADLAHISAGPELTPD